MNYNLLLIKSNETKYEIHTEILIYTLLCRIGLTSYIRSSAQFGQTFEPFQWRTHRGGASGVKPPIEDFNTRITTHPPYLELPRTVKMTVSSIMKILRTEMLCTLVLVKKMCITYDLFKKSCN